MENNPICRQIPWDNNPEYLEAWRMGRTGFPFIDAIMTQLREEGWIHHLARHAVACFLTRGDLYQSWTNGQDVYTLFKNQFYLPKTCFYLLILLRYSRNGY
jgi:cryptochrome